MQDTRTVVVAGAGVAGCIFSAAIADLADLNLIVLEEVSAEDHTAAGTGLNIGPNAAKALRLHAPQLLSDIRRVSAPWRRWRISDVGGAQWQAWDILDLADDTGIRVRWATLYQVLRERIRKWVRFESTVSRVGYAADGRLTVEYLQPDGAHRIDGVDLVVAGDGRYSRVRLDLSGQPECFHYGVAIGRLMVPDTCDGLVTDYEQWFHGPNRLLAFQVPTDSVYIAATMPIPAGGEIPMEIHRPDYLRNLYAPRDRKLCAAAEWIVDQLAENASSVHWARFQNGSNCFHDDRNGALYLGDAAHPMLPTIGQGATQAVEDGCIAGSLFRAGWDGIRASRSNLPAVLRCFNALRGDRIAFTMDLSVRAADTIRGLVDSTDGTREKQSPAFRAELRRLFADVPSEDAVRSSLSEKQP